MKEVEKLYISFLLLDHYVLYNLFFSLFIFHLKLFIYIILDKYMKYMIS